jgi:hypothetical protein
MRSGSKLAVDKKEDTATIRKTVDSWEEPRKKNIIHRTQLARAGK